VSRREIAKTLDLALELKPLKDFQKRTVDHVVHHLYDRPDTKRRFLVADEVGLGKTMVARGVIAHAIDRLRGKVGRIDVVYVCSNAAIAQQNLNRLNVLKATETTLATRLTLLPERIRSLDAQDVNFVSFTPATTFDLKSRGGIKEERAVLYRLLEGNHGLKHTPLRNLLQVNVGDESWDRAIEVIRATELAPELGQRFVEELGKSPVLGRVQEACLKAARRDAKLTAEDVDLRLRVIGELRSLLARVCIHALEPDLVILDEFQRFKDLLSGQSEAAELARLLFDYPDVRVLLLSATPYRMVTLGHDKEENHHRDFLDTVRFLAGGDEASVSALADDLAAYRSALEGTHTRGEDVLVKSRGAIEARLLPLMCRTERVGNTVARDAMMRDVRLPCPLEPRDIGQAFVVDRVARALGTSDTIEYWKSAPYLLSFMERYQLKERLEKKADDPPEPLLEALRQGDSHALKREQVERYEAIPFANARLRSLAASTIDAGQWRLLWLPPSMPYVKPRGPYADLGASGLTKSLVFSSWSVVPDVIAALLSYESERRAVGEAGLRHGYEKHSRARRPLLTFRVDAEDRPTGMPALGLLYPSALLASYLDPLAIALDQGRGEPVELDEIRRHVSERIRRLVERLTADSPSEGPIDQRWYWAAPVLLDASHQKDAIAWIAASDGLAGLYAEEEQDEDEPDAKETGYARHVHELLRVARGEEKLGRPPPDLLEVIADLTLASPAICAARAIRRVAGVSSWSDPAVLGAAARIARGFRVLFNVPESIELLMQGRSGDDENDPYWRSVLGYCVAGNLQAVLDEYAHLLVESEGVMGHESGRIANVVSATMLNALSPRTSSLKADEIRVRPRKGAIELHPMRFRCRFALRYGQLRSESDKELARAEVVRDSFNSPFRPFVLASTSIGQEGLDFHRYCHAVVHWNLPNNPVDMEQREGRVHRYKGHAVRRNLAKSQGLAALVHHWDGEGDPWARLFDLAAAARPAGATALSPYWIHEVEGGVSVERRVPVLPLSREVAQYERLKRSLALYRLVFGQARQEDLLAFLGEREGAAELGRFRISLEPR
jgi:hypothetical protein